MTARKGIILAGGSGTRLYPITMGVSKQLLPVYDKPMIYYPLSVLMLAGIREIAIITTPEDQAQFQRLMGDGSQWGLAFTWIMQPSPDGLAQAYLLAEDFLAGAPSAMVLGDNIFFGHGLPEILARADEQGSGGTVFGYQVSDPERYGVVGFDASGTRAAEIVEKPEVPPSNYAVTGLYFLDGTAPARARTVKPSPRGELEITSLLSIYLAKARCPWRRWAAAMPGSTPAPMPACSMRAISCAPCRTARASRSARRRRSPTAGAGSTGRCCWPMRSGSQRPATGRFCALSQAAKLRQRFAEIQAAGKQCLIFRA